MITPRALYAAAAGFAVVGAAFRLAPPPSPGTPVAAEVRTAAAASPARGPDATPSTFAAVVSANAFSPTRSPPAVRYIPPGKNRPDTAAPPRRPAKPAEPAIRVFGITKSAGGAVALIEADPKVPGAEVYRVGDRIKGSPITAITESTVVVARQPRPLVLRLLPDRKRR